MAWIDKYLQYNLDLNQQIPKINYSVPLLPSNFGLNTNRTTINQSEFFQQNNPNNSSSKSVINPIIEQTTSFLSDGLIDSFNSQTDDSMLGQGLGTLFSSGVSAAANTAGNNLLKGAYFTDGMGKNVLTSVKGSAAGLGANLIGKGINSLEGNSMLSRGIGQGVATGLGTVGARLLTSGTKNLFGSTSSIANAAKGLKNVKDATQAADLARKASAINPLGLGMQVVGTGLDAAFGPSKEYEGTYGDITRGMDTAYDSIQAAVGFIPGGGQIAAGAMALNKGLSNIFGSTSGMTKQDAILGSAFMPAPVKWLNMAGAKTTGRFHNQSWQNTMKADSFMGNAFGDLGDRFDQARNESGKTYGTFSHGAYRRAQDNLNFANQAWKTVLAMADQNELQNIRSQYMSSINNQRYAQNIQGGWQPTYRGKQGMKILNNATNHNIGQRLLSGAALIDNKQIILCNVPD